MRRLEDVGCSAPIFITREEYRWAVASEAEALGLVDHRIVLEPKPRGTAAAICTAATIIARDTPDALMLVTPSDQIMTDTLALADAVSRGAETARNGGIVVFGVTPTEPDVAFGYIETSDPTHSLEPRRFAGFVEKPDLGRARDMVASGRHLWNAGLFLATAETFCSAFAAHADDIARAAQAAVETGVEDLGFFRLGDPYLDAPSIAFDRAVMEKCDGWVVPLDAGWSDLGSWRGVWSTVPQDAGGVATIGAAQAIDCKASLLMSSSDAVEVVGIGLTNIAAIATGDAVLVVDLDNSQAVATAVHRLKAKDAPQADQFTSDFRPWGHFEVLAKGTRFQVKSIVVRPGGKLSLQSHSHRAEHWVVVEGTATVTIAETTHLVTENQSVYIPIGARHRLANEGRQPLRLIEVQTGTYLEEDDIVRHDDVYART